MTDRRRHVAEIVTAKLNEAAALARDHGFVLTMDPVLRDAQGAPAPPPTSSGDTCPTCGGLMDRSGGCLRCLNCGEQGGCG